MKHIKRFHVVPKVSIFACPTTTLRSNLFSRHQQASWPKVASLISFQYDVEELSGMNIWISESWALQQSMVSLVDCSPCVQVRYFRNSLALMVSRSLNETNSDDKIFFENDLTANTINWVLECKVWVACPSVVDECIMLLEVLAILREPPFAPWEGKWSSRDRRVYCCFGVFKPLASRLPSSSTMAAEWPLDFKKDNKLLIEVSCLTKENVELTTSK